MLKITGCIVFLFFTGLANGQNNIIEATRSLILSPDKNIAVQFYQKQLTDSTKAMYYAVNYKNKPVVYESLLDVEMDNHLSEQAMALKVDRHANWCENLQYTGKENFSKD